MRFLEVTLTDPPRDLAAWKQVTEQADGSVYVDMTNSPYGVSSSTASRFMAALKLGFKQSLWVLSKLIIASPLFVLLQFSLNGTPYAKYVIVGFVLLVCGFFAALNAFVLFSFLHHFYEKRANLVASARDPERYASDLFATGHVELSGRVRALTRGDVITQHCSFDPGFRLTLANDFVLEEPSGRLTFVSVEEPVTLAAPQTQALELDRHVDLFRLLDRSPSDGGETMALRDGARVRIITPRVAPVANLERIEVGDVIKSAARDAAVGQMAGARGQAQGRYREALGSGQLVRASSSTLMIASS